MTNTFPNSIELQTGELLNVLIVLIPNNRLTNIAYRAKIQSWLSSNNTASFSSSCNSNDIYLEYSNQRGGANSQHWWRLFFSNSLKPQIEKITNSVALVASNKGTNFQSQQVTQGIGNPPLEWGGMSFWSQTEIKIAEQLDKKGVLFFANARGRKNGQGFPVSVTGGIVRLLEIDFLVFYKGKLITLEVDGKHHQQNGQIDRDYIRDRILLREGIPTARFTASECYNHTEAVIHEFLSMF